MFSRVLEGEYVFDAENIVASIICVIFTGMASGLTMGVASLDPSMLRMKRETGTEEEKAAVEKLLPIVKQHHLLLVSLILCNSLFSESLPIFLTALLPNYAAIIVSVSLILIFGELVPQSLFSGHNRLIYAARSTSIVYCIMGCMYPFAYPVSLLLDKILGKHDDEDDKHRAGSGGSGRSGVGNKEEEGSSSSGSGSGSGSIVGKDVSSMIRDMDAAQLQEVIRLASSQLEKGVS